NRSESSGNTLRVRLRLGPCVPVYSGRRQLYSGRSRWPHSIARSGGGRVSNLPSENGDSDASGIRYVGSTSWGLYGAGSGHQRLFRRKYNGSVGRTGAGKGAGAGTK